MREKILLLLLIITISLAQDFKLKSPAFANGDFIPQKYTCKGKDVSPPLYWENIPKGTKYLAIIMDDPDAPMGTWIHWVIYNIPADKYSRLPEAIPTTRETQFGIQGLNSWEKYGYGGPCPPNGTHRYFFKIYALKDKLPETIKTKNELLKQMKPLILGKTTLMGKFSK